MDGVQIYEKEFLQERHYKLLLELQNMCRELPPIFQQRLPYELLSDLANSLLDKTVFDIVKGLKDIQDMTENNLLERRMKMVNSHKATREKMLKRHKEALINESQISARNAESLKAKQDKEIEELDKWHEEELNRLDMKIIMELDQTVSEQQVTLEKVGVPGFVVSNKEFDITLQMYLLKFITALSLKESAEQ